jgi:hypothetical protein
VDGPATLFFIFLAIINAKGKLDTSVTQAEACPDTKKAAAIFTRWQKKHLIRHFDITCYEVKAEDPET